MLVILGIGVYYLGVECKFWEGFSSCIFLGIGGLLFEELFD